MRTQPLDEADDRAARPRVEERERPVLEHDVHLGREPLGEAGLALACIAVCRPSTGRTGFWVGLRDGLEAQHRAPIHRRVERASA